MADYRYVKTQRRECVGLVTLDRPEAMNALNEDVAREVTDALLAFDADDNGSGQQAANRLWHRLRAAGVAARRVELPDGHDPASFFAGGGDAPEFQRLLERAQP